jgi:hypothetical protein
MSESMGGPHHFLIRVPSNDPTDPEVQLHFRAIFGP